MASWLFEGSAINFTESRYSLGDVGLMLGALTISGLEYSDRGEYTCEYTNENGMDTSSAILTVQGTILHNESERNLQQMSQSMEKIILIYFLYSKCSNK